MDPLTNIELCKKMRMRENYSTVILTRNNHKMTAIWTELEMQNDQIVARIPIRWTSRSLGADKYLFVPEPATLKLFSFDE